jgi:rubrerythrin
MKVRWLAGAVCVAFLAWSFVNAKDAPKTTLADSLKAAYNAESTAKSNYEAFAAKANEEGFKSVAALFKAAAKSESVHIVKHEAAMKALGVEPKAEITKADVKTTKENLETALKGIGGKREVTFAAFVKQADAAKDAKVAISFKGAIAAENSLFKMFQQALDDLNGWKDGKEIIVCQICGYATTDLLLKLCPVCSALREKFDSFK